MANGHFAILWTRESQNPSIKSQAGSVKFSTQLVQFLDFIPNRSLFVIIVVYEFIDSIASLAD